MERQVDIDDRRLRALQRILEKRHHRPYDLKTTAHIGRNLVMLTRLLARIDAQSAPDNTTE